MVTVSDISSVNVAALLSASSGYPFQVDKVSCTVFWILGSTVV